ncbi:DUF2142 domain-containing protein [Clostridium sp. AM42-4]|nr:DUF2142 domain-containing protein [Clostridium sp. AM42-4]
MAGGLGVLYLFVLPPLSAPDEISHYVSAYRLSSQLIGQPQRDRYGRVLLRAQDAWVEDLDGDFIYEPDEDGNLQVTEESHEQAVKLGETLDESTYELFHALGINGQYAPERTAEIQAHGAYVSSTYPPVTTTPLAYVPQAIGISAARLLGLNTVCLLYFGRLCNLLFFIGMLYLAVKRIPFGKEVLLGVALLPMTLHLAASFSYDVMILGCMFLLTAVCLDLAFEAERVRIRDVVLLAVLAAVAGPCKMVYAPMLGLCLLVPVRKFGGARNWFVSAFVVAGAWAVSMYLVNSQVITTYATEADSYVAWAEEAGFSMNLLIHNPVLLVRMFYQTLVWNAKDMHITMIGGWLGNLDQVLDVPYLVVWILTLCLIGLALKIPAEQIRMNLRQRFWVGVLAAACAGLTMLSMLIAWTPLSSRVILGVQGRYFLPFLPVLLLAFKNHTVVLTKDKNRSILYLMCCLNGYALVRLFSIVCIRL